MELLTIALLSILLIVLMKLLERPKEAKYIDKIPGYRPWPIIGNLNKVLFVPKERFMAMNDEMGRELGRIYRTYYANICEVHLLKAEYVEPILSNTKNLSKGFVYDKLHPWLGTGLLTSKGEKWFAHRKMITPTFHFKILETFIDIFNENTQILVDRLKYESDKRTTFDICPYITRCALDIICETAMGTKIDAQSKSESKYVSAVYKVSDITMQRHMKFWLNSDFLFYKSSYGKEYVKQLKVLHGFTENVIRERMQLRKDKQGGIEESQGDNDVGMKNRKMFIDLLLDANINEMNQLSETDIREEVDTFMFEGHDTTTAAICWSLCLLGAHQKIQDEAYEELHTMFGDDLTRHPTMQELNDMKCLERCIKEALRLYPSVPFITRQLEEGLTIGQYYIPKKVTAVLHIREVHQDPEYFPEPEKFNPDRFLPENVQKRHPYAYIPFSAGPRNCIGQKFALLEEKAVLSTLLRNYKFETIGNYEDICLLIELVLRPSGGIEMKISPRK